MGWPMEPAQGGYAIVAAKSESDATLNFRPFLLTEPNNVVCGQSSLSDSCKLVANPTFDNNASGWSLSAQAAPTTPGNPAGKTTGLHLIGGQARQLQPDPTHSYVYIISLVHHVGTPGTTYGVYEVQLGDTEAFPVAVNGTTTSTQTTTIPAQTYTPGEDGLFEFKISRISGGPDDGLVVDFACISDEDEPPPAPAGGCLLFNPEFDNVQPDYVVWEKTATVTYSDGLAFMSHTATISQTLPCTQKTPGRKAMSLQ